MENTQFIEQLRKDKKELESAIENLIYDFHKKHLDICISADISTHYENMQNSEKIITSARVIINLYIE